jgi:hypothetical protein
MEFQVQRGTCLIIRALPHKIWIDQRLNFWLDDNVKYHKPWQNCYSLPFPHVSLMRGLTYRMN